MDLINTSAQASLKILTGFEDGHAWQVPVSMFTVLFAVARTVGWVAQWNEMAAQQQVAPKISRPRQARAPPSPDAQCYSETDIQT